MMMTLIASEGLPDCVSDGVRHQVSAMVIEVSAQKLAHERLASRLELAERRGSSARQQLCALPGLHASAHHGAPSPQVRQRVSSCARSARPSVQRSVRCFSDARRRRLGPRRRQPAQRRRYEKRYMLGSEL